jgi:hypothetical protein
VVNREVGCGDMNALRYDSVARLRSDVCRVGHRHHGRTRPRLTDGGDG